jgi:hypothetical protein
MGSIVIADLKVRVFKGNDAQPANTVTIPRGAVKIARNLVPQRAMAAPRDQGIIATAIGMAAGKVRAQAQPRARP